MFGIDFNRNQKLALCAIVGLSAIVLSYIRTSSAFSTPANEVVIRDAGADDVVSSDSDPLPTDRDANGGMVVFHIVGCVKKPGLYRLPAGSRVTDAIQAAGGPTSEADLQALNLAAKVEDGTKLCVQPVQMVTSPGFSPSALAGASRYGTKASGDSSSSPDKLRNPGDGVVNINSAGVEELQRLPGVGPATADKIAAYRRQVGRFARPEQLMDVSGIGPKKFEKMRPFVAL